MGRIELLEAEKMWVIGCIVLRILSRSARYEWCDQRGDIKRCESMMRDYLPMDAGAEGPHVNLGVGSRRNLRRLHTINPHIPTQQDHHNFAKVRDRNHFEDLADGSTSRPVARRAEIAKRGIVVLLPSPPNLWGSEVVLVGE